MWHLHSFEYISGWTHILCEFLIHCLYFYLQFNLLILFHCWWDSIWYIFWCSLTNTCYTAILQTKQHAYRVNTHKHALLRNSECLLLAKVDRTGCFSKNYRNVNGITWADTFHLSWLDSYVDNIGPWNFLHLKNHSLLLLMAHMNSLKITMRFLQMLSIGFTNDCTCLSH